MSLRISQHYPLIFALLGCLISALWVYLLQEYSKSEWMIWLYIPLFPITVIIPAAAIASHLKKYKNTNDNIVSLAIEYLSLIIVYANIYFMVIVLTPGEVVAISGVMPPWFSDTCSTCRYMDLYIALYSAIDCFHFSVVTGTTLGYGDMVPKTYLAKLAVDSQVLLSIGLVAVRLGRMLSKTNA